MAENKSSGSRLNYAIGIGGLVVACLSIWLTYSSRASILQRELYGRQVDVAMTIRQRLPRIYSLLHRTVPDSQGNLEPWQVEASHQLNDETTALLEEFYAATLPFDEAPCEAVLVAVLAILVAQRYPAQENIQQAIDAGVVAIDYLRLEIGSRKLSDDTRRKLLGFDWKKK